MKTIKKNIAIALTVTTLSAPMLAQAILPLAGIALLVEAAGGAGPFALSAAAHAAVIGLIVFTPSNGSQSNPDLANKPITVQIDPNVPLTTPPGWTNDKTPPAQGAVEQLCPENTSNRVQCSNYSPDGNTCFFTQTMTFTPNSSGKCTRYFTNSDFTYVPNPYGIEPSGPTAAGDDFEKTPKCQPGYLQNGQMCTLQNPNDVKKPPKNKDEIRREGNEFKRDPQQDISDNNPNFVQESPNKISYTDPLTGEKVTISLNPTTGAATVSQSVPNRGNSTTSVQNTNISSPGTGSTVTGQSTETYPGVGDQTGTTPIPGGTGSGTGDCSHCATEATLSNLRDITNDIKTTLNGNNPMPEMAGVGIGDRLDGVQDGVLTNIGNSMRDMVTNSGLLQAYQNNVLPLSPWAIATEGQSASCEFSFSLMGKPYELSVCQAQPFLHTAIAFVLFIFTAVGIFHLVTERPEGN